MDGEKEETLGAGEKRDLRVLPDKRPMRRRYEEMGRGALQVLRQGSPRGSPLDMVDEGYQVFEDLDQVKDSAQEITPSRCTDAGI